MAAAPPYSDGAGTVLGRADGSVPGVLADAGLPVGGVLGTAVGGVFVPEGGDASGVGMSEERLEGSWDGTGPGDAGGGSAGAGASGAVGRAGGDGAAQFSGSAISAAAAAVAAAPAAARSSRRRHAARRIAS
ncbi:hypothetical protein FM21_00620 [Streptomyces mutabilis]|uniref:Uncharacterized protein n=1 Tax=Streptomyces mutabilis TaxID=67332 RepID=A0A086N0P6_9ACTN|nr:hypothetical protein FM21_00620 [Streptomyces mutabilis]